MAVEVVTHDTTFEVEEGDVSDSEAFSSLIGVLDGVRKAPSMISQADKDEYGTLISIVDPLKRLNYEEEALLVTVLKALSGAIFKIDVHFHVSLLSNIFDMSVWRYGLEDTTNALLELISSLASVPDKFLDGCLHMLVSNFVPPKRMRENMSESKWLIKKKEVHRQLYTTLRYITDLVPLAPVKLKDVIDRRMPRLTDPKEVILVFVECMLGLRSDEIGEFVGSTVLAKVVDMLTDLDVNITWEEILHEDNNKGIFDMELDDAHENADVSGIVGAKTDEKNGVLKDNAFTEKLDGLMVILCEHLKSCTSYEGHLVKAFQTLSESFRRTVLNAYKSKFVQFVMFYACSLDPEICGQMFGDLLTDIFVSKTEDPISRMSAVAYLASYLSRAKFVSSYLAANKLKRLVDWCFEYCQFQNGREMLINPKSHKIFYSACQAVMYILCFRMRSIMNIPELKSMFFHLPLEHIFSHPLNPLKVCLPTIVHEFLRQAVAAHLLKTSMGFLNDNLLLESAFSKDFGGIERLDMFFPFDPYLLKESDRFMRPNFEFWHMVRTTYSDFSSEEDDEDLDGPHIAGHEDLDEPHIAEDEQDDLLDSGSSDGDDYLEHSLNMMSITPNKPAFSPLISADPQNLVRMPARFRPSVSPDC